MHALGNNYIYVAASEMPKETNLWPRVAREISDVRRGIGSDGLIVVSPSERADVRMRIWNADGSEAETCGNGVRCVAKYAYDRGLVDRRAFTVETAAGVVPVLVHVRPETGTVERVTANMGAVRLGPSAVVYRGPVVDGPDVRVELGDATYSGTLVSVGNPHFVTLVADVHSVPLAVHGPQIERHPYFPERINVEFVSVRNRRELDFRVWERGSGITFACGTGACASVAAALDKGLVEERVTVHLEGGDLEIERRSGEMWMTGEAVTVFTGEYVWPDESAESPPTR